MIADGCPAPTQGPVPCPTTTDQVLDRLRRILPRGIAWISVFDESSVMYRYFRAISATYCWFTNECCKGLNEFFCATRNWLTEDYLVEFGLPDPCTCNTDPCLKPPETARCSDLVAWAALFGWALTCPDAIYYSSALCAVSGCASCEQVTPPASMAIEVSTAGSSVYNPGEQAASGLAVAGCTECNCTTIGCGTIAALHCLIDAFLPAHFQYTLTVVD